MNQGYLRFDFKNITDSSLKQAHAQKDYAFKQLLKYEKKGKIHDLTFVETESECLITWKVGKK